MHAALYKELAEFHGAEAAMVFTTGFTTNIGIFPTLCMKGDVILSDAQNHASIVDGCRLSYAKRMVVKHMNYKDLERKLKACQHYNRRFFVTEGVFSMEGNIPDLKLTLAICKKYDCHLIVDDCHGVGVLGKTGRGALEYWGVDINDICLLSATLAKGLGGGGGGYIAGKYEVVKYLNQRSRAYIYSTTVSIPVIAVSRWCLKYINDHPEMLEETRKKVR